MLLETGETVGAVWKSERGVQVQAYGIAVEPGRFVICWTCHVLSMDASELSEHLSEAHREEPAHLELSHPDERPVRLDDLTEDDLQRAEEVSAIAREHAVDIDLAVRDAPEPLRTAQAQNPGDRPTGVSRQAPRTGWALEVAFALSWLVVVFGVLVLLISLLVPGDAPYYYQWAAARVPVSIAVVGGAAGYYLLKKR